MVRAKAFICYVMTVGHIWHLEKYIYCDTFLDQGSRSERYLQIKAHFEV